MSMDLAINLVAALIAFGAGWATRLLNDYFRRRRPAGRVWRNPRREVFSVVVADGPVDTYGNASVHPAEFAAATEISPFLAQYFRADASQVSVSADFPIGPALERNLIVIGGPIHNIVYRTLADRMTIPYEFQNRVLVNKINGNSFTPVSTPNGMPEVDYGLIIIARNPFNSGSRVVLLAGCRTFGCLGAARTLVGPLLHKVAPLAAKSETCSVVVKMDVLASWVGRLEIVDYSVS